MTGRAFPWSRLGIDPTDDKAAIRKAYADVLRGINPDDDIAGFAELRRARDHALWLAGQAELASPQEDEGEIYGLGTLDDDEDGAGLWADDAADDRWTTAPAATDPVDAAPGPAPQLSEAQQRAQAAWNTMLDVLYPAGETSDEAVTHEELDQGLAALDILIRRAEEADIEEHDALDSALAELFARTWPRSAPFVEPADTAFHWIGESGTLDERYALRFLNDRLRGMRFHDKVQQPGHPLHKAWAELSRPGRANLIDRLRVKRLDVHKLLLGIRERYPELESFLDAERVRSWEGPTGTSAEGYTDGRRNFFGVVMFALVFFALLRGFSALVGPDDRSTGNGDRAESAEVAERLRNAEYDIAAMHAFGNDTRMADVRAADPVFAADIAKVVRTVGSSRDVVMAVARSKALQSGTAAGFDGLVARAELRRIWLAGVLESPDQCRGVMRGDFVNTPLTLGKDDKAREQALLKRLLVAKSLRGSGDRQGGSFSVPGWVVDGTIKASGLGADTVTAALRDPENAARCKVEYAMLGVMLKQPGKVPAELLRVF